MKFIRAFVRSTPLTQAIPKDEYDRLAGLLVDEPTEIEFRAAGAFRHGRPLDGVRALATALARRNIHALLARPRPASHVRTALGLALVEPPEEAEEALEAAGLELNLRLSLFATDDARLTLTDDTLVIEDDRPADVLLEERDYPQAGRQFFCTEALSRLVGSGIGRVRFSPTAVWPVFLQLVPGAVMDADTAEGALRKGDRRLTHKPHFEKEFCITCGRCFIHCPDNAIRHVTYDPENAESTGILGIHYDRCTACGTCAAVCPTNKDGYKAMVMIGAEQVGDREVHHVA